MARFQTQEDTEMISLKKMAYAAAFALAALAVDASVASAQFRPNCNGPFCNQGTPPRYSTLHSYIWKSHNQPALPVYQAAPWYLYWPYDAHFQTPAPVHAPFYAPPVGGNFPVNPYFPAPAGQYGPIPGGPAPAGVPAPGGFGFGQ
ncbi:MAG: hypothetical protein U0791_13520 [Gemmataceae bacterium]